MRVTQNMTAENSVYNLQQGRKKLDRLQEQVSSGQIINRPSDDPISARKLLDLGNKIAEGDQYASNITKGNLWLSTTATAMVSINQTVDEAKKVVSNITSGSSNATERANANAQLTELKKQLIDLGNTQMGDQYLFAGFNSGSPPFSQGSNVYSGTSDKVDVEIDRGSRLTVNVLGNELLKGTGTYGSVDILQTIDDLMTAITANNVPNIQANARLLDSATNQIQNAQSDLAGRQIRMQSAKTIIDRNQNTMKNMISDINKVDDYQVAVELSQQQTALEAALSTTAKINNLSMLDYL